MRRWLVTGASKGLGRAIAEAALARGDAVVLAARNPAPVAGLVAQHPDTARAVTMDVADADSRARGVAAAEAAFGGIDVLVNNAGYVVLGAVEEVPPADYRPVFETNLFGAVEVMRLLLPGMRARRHGRVVSMSAMGGIVASAGIGYYCATKFALEAVSEAVAAEVASLGIKVTIVEPGNFRTEVIRARVVGGRREPDYDETAGPLLRRFAGAHGTQPGDPRRLAAAVLAVVDMPEPPLRLPLGQDAVTRIREKLARVERDVAAAEAVAVATAFGDAGGTRPA